MSFFKFLETRYSETNEKFLSKKWATYMPDFFLIFFFISLILTSCFLDLILLVFLFNKTNIILWLFFLIASYFRIIFELIMDLRPNVTSAPNKKISLIFFELFFTILGMHSITISSIILRETFKKPNIPNQLPDCITYPAFHISNENLSLIKIYCYIHVGVRCIPQLFIMSVFIGLKHSAWMLVYMSTANIFLNMVLFSFMISITLPIRKTPRVFVSFLCLVFSAFNKFLATLCGCCASMTIFMAMFRKVGYYALLAHFFKIIIWMIPCQILLSTRHLPKLHFVIYLIFFPVVFSFIFIHPFENTWMLYYYFFYLLIALVDLVLLGLWTDADLLDLSYYSILRFLQVGFISLFGLLNGLKKGKNCQLKLYTSNNINKITEQDENEASSSENIKKTEVQIRPQIMENPKTKL